MLEVRFNLLAQCSLAC